MPLVFGDMLVWKEEVRRKLLSGFPKNRESTG
jgi:hypothetical protein